jgi:pentapeptide MXKDX repeat protein
LRSRRPGCPRSGGGWRGQWGSWRSGCSVGLGGVVFDTAPAQSDTLKKDEMTKDGMMKQDDMQKGQMMKDDKMKKDDAMMEEKQ